jgi:hypothetical protein
MLNMEKLPWFCHKNPYIALNVKSHCGTGANDGNHTPIGGKIGGSYKRTETFNANSRFNIGL